MAQRRARVPGPGDSKAIKVPSRAHVAVSIKPQVPVAAVCRQCGPKERTGRGVGQTHVHILSLCAVTSAIPSESTAEKRASQG